MRKRPTSKDVARLAGVSQTVVSFVLNNHASVAPLTRERVREAAKSLGYRPDALARSLVSGRSHTVGVLMVDLENPFFAKVAHSLEIAIRKAGYHFILNTSSWDAWGTYDSVSSMIEELLARRVDAVLAWSGWGYDEKVKSEDPFKNVLESHGHRTPFFVIGYHQVADGCVMLDHEKGGIIAGKHLLDCRCKRIGVVSNNLDGRYTGLIKALVDGGYDRQPDLFRESEFPHENRESGYVTGRRIAALPRDVRPDGLFCHNDLVGIGVLCGVLDGGLRVPQDISIVGFDALQDSLYVRPTLTSVAFPLDSMCQTVVSRLVDHLASDESKADEPNIVLMAPIGLRQGMSTSPFAPKDS